MTISVSDFMGIPVVKIVGRITDAEEPGVKPLSRTLRDVCRGTKGRVVVDVTTVQFLDSHALGVLVFYNTIMEKAGRKLVFLNASRTETSYMTKLFNYTNLCQIFQIIDRLDEAHQIPGKPGR